MAPPRWPDLEITEPIVLSNSDSRHEFYVPVPRGVPIADAAPDFRAKYTKGEPGPHQPGAEADGVPLNAWLHRQWRSPASRGATRSIRVAAKPASCGWAWTWQSEIALRHESNRATANALTISPQTP